METEGKAIRFIDIDEETEKFEISSEAMAFLASLPREAKIKVISIAGPYRTGKSFMMNRFLDQMSGFEIGATIESCTKGVWIWNQPIFSDDEEEIITLLMDTEGLHSSQRTTDVDLKIFALSVLLSSSFILNQLGPINENTLTDLHLISNLVKFFGQKKNSKGEYESQHESYPDFYWLLRDFYHDIEEFDGPTQYMEDCLKPVMGVNKDTLAKNRIRKSITSCFHKRECVTLIRPVDDEHQLAHIQDLQWDDLKP